MILRRILFNARRQIIHISTNEYDYQRSNDKRNVTLQTIQKYLIYFVLIYRLLLALSMNRKIVNKIFNQTCKSLNFHVCKDIKPQYKTNIRKMIPVKSQSIIKNEFALVRPITLLEIKHKFVGLP